MAQTVSIPMPLPPNDRSYPRTQWPTPWGTPVNYPATNAPTR